MKDTYSIYGLLGLIHATLDSKRSDRVKMQEVREIIHKVLQGEIKIEDIQ